MKIVSRVVALAASFCIIGPALAASSPVEIIPFDAGWRFSWAMIQPSGSRTLTMPVGGRSTCRTTGALKASLIRHRRAIGTAVISSTESGGIARVTSSMT
ncbi:MAG TPA: hypothetical protein VL793_17635 [Patescibacteria group bacterium]|nr:hypothetical protein [Patescibacteria group bacterium]